MQRRRRHPLPYGGGSYENPNPSFFTQNPNLNFLPQNPNLDLFPFNHQFYQQQQFYSPQNPNFENPVVQTLLNALPQNQNPNFQNFQNPSPRPPHVTIERVESAVAKAQVDLVTAGENVNAWKVSQAALVSLQADSWRSLEFQLRDVPSLRRLLATEEKINEYIHCFVGAQKITSLYDLEVAICKNEGIERFEKLGLGPLSRHPLSQHYFSIPSNSDEIFKISREDIFASLRSLMNKSNKRTVSAEELLGFIAEQKSVPVKEKLGIRIQSLGVIVADIRQVEKSEKTFLYKFLEDSKRNGEESDDTGEKEKETPLKDKLVDVWGRSSCRSKSYSKKQKRKRQEKHANTMNKFLRKEEDIGNNESLRNATSMKNFVARWKAACREHSATEVLNQMIDFYMATITEEKRGTFQRIFSSLPGVGLLNVAVSSIKCEFSDSLYDTVQISGDHCSAPSAGITEINPSVREDLVSNTTKDIDEHGYSHISHPKKFKLSEAHVLSHAKLALLSTTGESLGTPVGHQVAPPDAAGAHRVFLDPLTTCVEDLCPQKTMPW